MQGSNPDIFVNSKMMEHQIEIYTSPDGSTQIEVQFEGDTFG